jgi:hypothetical protein
MVVRPHLIFDWITVSGIATLKAPAVVDAVEPYPQFRTAIISRLSNVLGVRRTGRNRRGFGALAG